MSEQQSVVIVKDLYKSFRLPHEQHSGVKQLIVNFAKQKKGYEVQHVLDDISFDIKKGEFFGIVGRNGSGKSTLLKLLAGIYAPDKGLVQVNGTLTPFIELGVGFNPELTGRENVYLNGALLGFSRQEMDDMYDEIVDFAELHDFMDQKLKNYSSGMQVRLAFSIAVRAKSDIILLDEVLAVGDAAFQKKCYDYFESLKHTDTTVIIVTHDMSAVKRFCTGAAYVADGRLVKQGDPFEIADLYLAANIAPSAPPTESFAASGFSLDSETAERRDDELIARFNYQAGKTEDLYLGISITKDGVSIAELTTPLDKPLRDNGSLLYTLDTSIFNGGVYSLESALFKTKNRELVAINKKKISFTVKEYDITKGAAVKLPASWKYETES